MSFVKEKAENINLGIDNMIDAMKKDYKDWSSKSFNRSMPEINTKMVDKYTKLKTLQLTEIGSECLECVGPSPETRVPEVAVA